jgi:hypothetical protein
VCSSDLYMENADSDPVENTNDSYSLLMEYWSGTCI